MDVQSVVIPVVRRLNRCAVQEPFIRDVRSFGFYALEAQRFSFPYVLNVSVWKDAHFPHWNCKSQKMKALQRSCLKPVYITIQLKQLHLKSFYWMKHSKLSIGRQLSLIRFMSRHSPMTLKSQPSLNELSISVLLCPLALQMSRPSCFFLIY